MKLLIVLFHMYNQEQEWIEWGPGWCVSVDWVAAWEPEGRWFDS